MLRLLRIQIRHKHALPDRPHRPNLTSQLFNTAQPESIEYPVATTAPSAVVPVDWTPVEKRSGVLAVKKGMLSIWDEWGRQCPVTVLQLEDTFVVGHKTKRVNGYDALVVGCRGKQIKDRVEVEKFFYHIETCIKAAIGKCLEKLTEFQITPNAFIPIGTKLSALHFVPGQFVDVQGLSKAKGFQGVMKRWGFKGQSKSHGTSLSHRSAGSIGQRKDPGKVFKGKKMAGHMGGEYVTAMSLRVLKIDKQLDLIYVKGSVPGPDGSIIKIRDAIWKRDQFDPYTLPPPFPTADREKIDSSPAELTIKSPEGAADPLAVQYKL